ncbi:hypothetical protein VB780_31080 [Leptolyngbya sp. CCNP1308]|uniref:hypothetical protein n=1 Tax=Leptolyngbya sp. CCNP1308 TaxID=3110255 RepID=UPI002B218168|nr:hypothetical protein [Leptolyngbya sp. CCNP1308]MEA5453056.1 hypothetical protein [Leptolyngbya sp. CCNP1308]
MPRILGVNLTPLLWSFPVMSDEAPRRDYLTRFQQQGEVAMAERPLCVRLPEDIDGLMREKKNRTAWLRDAIMEKLWREGALPERYRGLMDEEK